MGDGRGVEWERKRRWGQEGKREWVEGMLASATRQSLTNAVTGARLFSSARSVEDRAGLRRDLRDALVRRAGGPSVIDSCCERVLTWCSSAS